jgi:hypothetical protein
MATETDTMTASLATFLDEVHAINRCIYALLIFRVSLATEG